MKSNSLSLFDEAFTLWCFDRLNIYMSHICLLYDLTGYVDDKSTSGYRYKNQSCKFLHHRSYRSSQRAITKGNVTYGCSIVPSVPCGLIHLGRRLHVSADEAHCADLLSAAGRGRTSGSGGVLGPRVRRVG